MLLVSNSLKPQRLVSACRQATRWGFASGGTAARTRRRDLRFRQRRQKRLQAFRDHARAAAQLHGLDVFQADQIIDLGARSDDLGGLGDSE